MTAASAAIGLVTAVEVSFWVSSTAFQGRLGREGARRTGGIGGLAPVEGELGDVRAVNGGDLGEAIAEGADGDGQDLVAGGEEADDRRLEATGAGRGDDEDVVLGPSRTSLRRSIRLQGRELRTAMVDHLAGARLADTVGQGRRAGDAKVGLEAVHGCHLWAGSRRPRRGGAHERPSG